MTFRNQPSGPSSTPDARIRASFSYWIETKRKPNSVRVNQLRAHLEALEEEPPIDTQRLLVLTPDSQIPAAVIKAADDRMAWASFEDLVNAINLAIEIDKEWLASDSHIPTERERELMRELVRFLNSEGLVGRAVDEVLVVATRRALAEYQNYDAYICQPNRPFRSCSHMAFYANGRIQRQIPKIIGKIEQIMLTKEGIDGYKGDNDLQERLTILHDEMIKYKSHRVGELVKVLFLI